MLEIKVEIEKEDAQKYLKEHGIDRDISDKLIMCAYDEGKLAGVGAISLTLQRAVIETVCCNKDLELAMGKALLNLIDLGGITKVCCYQPELYSFAKRLGFLKSEAEAAMELDLTGYFTAGCHSS